MTLGKAQRKGHGLYPLKVCPTLHDNSIGVFCMGCPFPKCGPQMVNPVPFWKLACLGPNKPGAPVWKQTTNLCISRLVRTCWPTLGQLALGYTRLPVGFSGLRWVANPRGVLVPPPVLALGNLGGPEGGKTPKGKPPGMHTRS